MWVGLRGCRLALQLLMLDLLDLLLLPLKVLLLLAELLLELLELLLEPLESRRCHLLNRPRRPRRVLPLHLLACRACRRSSIKIARSPLLLLAELLLGLLELLLEPSESRRCHRLRQPRRSLLLRRLMLLHLLACAYLLN